MNARPFRFLLSFALVVGVASAAEAPVIPATKSVEELRAQLEAQIGQARFSPALWGVKIASLDTGRVLFESHADRRLSPASNSKLYTGALALDQLGADYRIVTPIFGSAAVGPDGTLAGDVIVSGRGDPSWKSSAGHKDFAKIFAPFVAVLKQAGVKRVTGDLVADTTFFVGVPNGAGWTADDLNDDYGAEVSAITLDDNFVELRVTPGAAVDEPGEVTLLQPHSGLVLDNRTKTVPKGETHLTVRRIFGENVVHLFGDVALGGKETITEATVPQPALWFATALRAALAEQGIHVDGRARSVRWPDPSPVAANAVKLGEIASPPLGELVRAFMKPSQNLETDLIFDHLGELRRGPHAPVTRTSEDCGVIVLQDFLKQNGLPVDDVRFEEGSGLSRNNLTTANATVALLTFMAAHRHAKEFIDALPIAGVDGTLKKRMTGTPAQGNLRAKTGSLRYANSLSGYITSAAGERLVFSLMLNRNVQPTGRNVREELDDIAVLLAKFAGRSGGAAGAP